MTHNILKVTYRIIWIGKSIGEAMPPSFESHLCRARAMGDSCPCWDGKLKGTYSLDKKNVMFNIEAESLGIFALTVLFTCITYSGFKTILKNFFEGHLRVGALLPVAANVHGKLIFELPKHWVGARCCCCMHCFSLTHMRHRRVLSLVRLLHLHE